MRANPMRMLDDGTVQELVGTDSIVLVYACGLPDGTEKPGADLMRVGSERKVVEWRCHY